MNKEQINEAAYKALDAEITEGKTTEAEKKMFIQGFLQYANFVLSQPKDIESLRDELPTDEDILSKSKFWYPLSKDNNHDWNEKMLTGQDGFIKAAKWIRNNYFQPKQTLSSEVKLKSMTEQLRLTNSDEDVANYIRWIIKSDESKEYWLHPKEQPKESDEDEATKKFCPFCKNEVSRMSIFCKNCDSYLIPN